MKRVVNHRGWTIHSYKSVLQDVNETRNSLCSSEKRRKCVRKHECLRYSSVSEKQAEAWFKDCRFLKTRRTIEVIKGR